MKMTFVFEYMMKLNNYSDITVLEGDGEFLEYDTNEVYKIHSIKIPFSASGKHITVYSKEDDEVVEDREYFDGKILSFSCEKIDHWNFK